MKPQYVVLFVGSIVMLLLGVGLVVFTYASGIAEPWTGLPFALLGAVGTAVAAKELWGTRRGDRSSDDK